MGSIWRSWWIIFIVRPLKMIYVIIPTYNRAHTLPRAIDSCLSQKWNYKIIIVDDGSNDNTKEIVSLYISQHHNKIIYFYRENWGVSSACNSWIKIVLKDSQNHSQDYVTRLGSDDQLSPQAIHIYGTYIKRYPSNNLFFFSMSNGKWESHSLITQPETIITYSEYLSWKYILWADADGLMKLSALEDRENRFIEGLHGGDNIAFQKIMRKQNQCVIVNKRTYIAHIDTVSMTRSVITKEYCKQLLNVQLKVLEIFYDDYMLYNKKLIWIHSLIISRNYWNLGNHRQSIKYLIVWIRNNPKDFIRIMLAILSLLPYSLNIINLIIKLFITYKLKKNGK